MTQETSDNLFTLLKGEKEAPSFETGVLLLVNKPIGWTSFDVVKKLRYLIKIHFGIKKLKVGHAGTLDPLAEGLLLICTGKYTKQIDKLQGQKKIYEGIITLGATTPSYDKETEINETFDYEHLSDEIILENTKKFVGEIEQVPPIYSAIRVGGERLYKKARRGETNETFKIKKRTVEIYKFDITNIEMPEVSFLVECSKGTYIRSLAYDFGASLENGGYLSQLNRTHIGSYDVKDAWEIDEFIDFCTATSNIN